MHLSDEELLAGMEDLRMREEKEYQAAVEEIRRRGERLIDEMISMSTEEFEKLRPDIEALRETQEKAWAVVEKHKAKRRE